MKNLIYRADGRVEWTCDHGVGHTLFYPTGSDEVHGCDGCCGKSDEFKNLKLLVRYICLRTKMGDDEHIQKVSDMPTDIKDYLYTEEVPDEFCKNNKLKRSK
ncbi:MAG: hypothetical protein WC307_06970 [Candidatus Nanoarchaeia archaeon]|jgi:hypothetical protein